MSVKSYSKPNNRKYFAEFFNKGFIIPAILFALIFTTILAMINQFDFSSQLTTKNNKLFALVFILFYVACLVVYSTLSIKSDKVNMGDSVCVSFFLTAVLYLGYLAVNSLNALLTLKNIALIVCLAIFGIVLTLLNCVSYEGFEGDKETVLHKKGIKTYFSFVNKKYRFFGIIIASIIINCLFYLFLNLKYDFVNILSGNGVDASKYFFESIKDLIIVDGVVQNYVYSSLLGIGGLFLLIYALISAFDRRLNSLDLFVTASFVSVPVLGSMVYFLDNGSLQSNGIIVGGFLAFVIILSSFRYCFFNNPSSQEKLRKGYFKNIFLSKEFFKGVGVIALIVVFSYINANVNILSNFNQEGGGLYFYVGLMPYAIIFITCCLGFVAYAFGLIKVLLGLNDSSFQKSDRLVLFNLFFGIFTLAVELLMPLVFDKSLSLNVGNVVVFATYSVVSLGVMLMRKHSVK